MTEQKRSKEEIAQTIFKALAQQVHKGSNEWWEVKIARLDRSDGVNPMTTVMIEGYFDLLKIAECIVDLYEPPPSKNVKKVRTRVINLRK